MAINERNYVGFALNPTTGHPHRIRHLPRMIDWEPAVYMYEAGDKFVADIDGIDNLPGQQLANRTEYLYEQNLLLAEACRSMVRILKGISVGKTAVNGYQTALSRDRPTVFCAWVEPQENLGTVESISPVIEDTEGTAWQNPVSEIETDEGVLCYVGGNGDAFPRIVKIIGTVGLVLSTANLMQGGAWVQPSEDIGQIVSPPSDVVLEDGTVLDNPTAMVVNEDDEAYYVRTYAADKDPIYEEVVEINGFEVATHGDVDTLFAR